MQWPFFYYQVIKDDLRIDEGIFAGALARESVAMVSG